MVLINCPAIWLKMLPLIAPTGILTVSIPAYAVIRNIKEVIEKESEKQNSKPINMNQQTPIIEKKKNNSVQNQNTDLVDSIMNDHNLTQEAKKQILKELKSECEQEPQLLKETKDSQKIKKLSN